MFFQLMIQLNCFHFTFIVTFFIFFFFFLCCNFLFFPPILFVVVVVVVIFMLLWHLCEKYECCKQQGNITKKLYATLFRCHKHCSTLTCLPARLPACLCYRFCNVQDYFPVFIFFFCPLLLLLLLLFALIIMFPLNY